MNNLKFALRQLLKHPGFTAVAVLTLALGIGANTAIFSVLHAVVLSPFSYPESDRIVFVGMHDRTEDDSMNSFSYPNLMDYREQQEVFENFGGAMDGSVVVTGDMDPARVKGCYLNAELFSLLRTPPLLGRTLTPADEVRGGERVLVLNHSAWQRFYLGATDVVGKAIELDGQVYTIVGVMPPTFKFWDAQVYIPLIHGMPAEIENVRAATIGIWGVGRLKDGVSLETANAQLDDLGRRMEEAFPGVNANAFPRGRLLAETVGSQLRPTLIILFAAVGFVLLIACVNVTNLLLARGVARGRELAVRSALGADRRRIFRQLLMETVPLALLGGVVGVLLAWGGLKAIMMMIPANLIPAESNIRLSLPVLAFTMGTAVFAAMLAGVLPAVRASRLELNEGLKEGARGTGDSRTGRLRGSLIIAEVALALTLLVGAGLLLRDLSRLIKVDPGFDVERLVVVRMDLPEARYQDGGQIENFVNRVVERIGNLPGVQHAAVAQTVPFVTGTIGLPVMIAGKTYERYEDLESSTYNAVTPNAVAALGARLLEGRLLTESDRAGGEPVVLLNETAAKQFFPDSSALGKRVAAGFPASFADSDEIPAALINPPWATVVGVVSDVRQFGYMSEPQPQLIVPFEQSYDVGGLRNQLALMVRTAGAPDVVTANLRQELRGLDPYLPTDSIQTMTSLAEGSVRPQRFIALLLGIFAGIAALLAATGIYSVVAWSVAQRTREVGIRLALGASSGAVVARIIRQGLTPVAIGVFCGLLASLGLARLIGSQLVQVKSYDPVTYITVALLLIAVAVVACWIPARRVTRVDPMIALRAE